MLRVLVGELRAPQRLGLGLLGRDNADENIWWRALCSSAVEKAALVEKSVGNL